MGSDSWESLTLNEVAHYQNGRATKPAEARDDGLLVVKIRELNSGVSEKSIRVDPEAVEAKHRIRDGDLLFAWSASVGIYVWRGEEAALNQHIFKVQAKPGTDQLFLRYLLEHELGALLAAAAERQTTMGHVRKADLARLTCRRPPIEEQRAIAEVLGALDDRIEWCRTTQQLLRATLHARFQTGFRGGDSVRLGDVTETVPGRSYKSAELDEASPVGLVNLKNIPRHGGFNPAGVKGYTGPYRPQQVVQPGELVVACTDITQQGDVIGRAGRVRPNPTYPTMVISMDMAAIRPAVPWLSTEFLAEVLNTREYVDHVKRYVNGTTVLHLKKVALAEYETVMPTPEVIATFTEFAQPMWARHDVLDDEADALTRLRDSLLPRLLSGELRVENPVRVLGAA